MEKWRKEGGKALVCQGHHNVELHYYRYQFPMRLVLELLHIA